MSKKLQALLFFVAPIFTFAQEKGIDQQIDEGFGNEFQSKMNNELPASAQNVNPDDAFGGIDDDVPF